MNLTLLQMGPAQNLGWTLIHFLWQGAAVAVAVKLALLGLTGSSARARYLVACTGLAALLLCPLATFSVLRHGVVSAGSHLSAATDTRSPADKHPEIRSAPQVVVRITAPPHSSLAAIPGWLEARLPWVLLAWGTGVLILSIRLAGGWWLVRRLAERGLPLEEAAWQERLSRAIDRLGVTRPVKLVRSAFVQVPTAVGWLRPIVLLPMSSLTGLAPAELEALLAHELAHVCRHDYLVNLLQSVVETLLFYHPAVWWISSQIRIEREHACDDLVVSAYADRITYARALANLEARRSPSCRQLALSATGGSLAQRIRRLVGQPAANRTSAGWMFGMAVPVAFACVLLSLRSAPASGASGTSSNAGELPALTGISETATNPGPFERHESAPDQLPHLAKPGVALAGENQPVPPTTQPLFTRAFKVDPDAFLASIGAARARTRRAHDPGAPEAFSPKVDFLRFDPLEVADPLEPLVMKPIFEQVRDYFRANGFDTSPSAPELGQTNAAQKALFFNAKTGLILVRGTKEELDRVERVMQANAAPPQVTIEIKFTEVAEQDINEIGLGPLLAGGQTDPNSARVAIHVTNRTGYVTQPASGGTSIQMGQLFDNPGLRNIEQVSPGVACTISAERFRAIIRALEQKSGTDLLSAPRVTTLSGRQARIEVIELKNVVTAVSISTDARNETSANYIPLALPTGPAVDVVPYVAVDGKTIHLFVAPSWTEFLGYDDPGGAFVPQGTFDGNKLSPPLQIQQPLPRFHAVQATAQIAVRDGETVVMMGFGGLLSQSKHPESGKSYKAASRSNRQLVVFVTPVLVDPAGNRVHPE